jgi:hypothetical protein
MLELDIAPNPDKLAFNRALEVVSSAFSLRHLVGLMQSADAFWAQAENKGGGWVGFAEFFDAEFDSINFIENKQWRGSIEDQVEIVQQTLGLLALSRLTRSLFRPGFKVPALRTGEIVYARHEKMILPPGGGVTRKAPYGLHLHQDFFPDDMKIHVGWSRDLSLGLYTMMEPSQSRMQASTVLELGDRRARLDISHMKLLEPWLTFKEFQNSAA